MRSLIVIPILLMLNSISAQNCFKNDCKSLFKTAVFIYKKAHFLKSLKPPKKFKSACLDRCWQDVHVDDIDECLSDGMAGNMYQCIAAVKDKQTFDAAISDEDKAVWFDAVTAVFNNADVDKKPGEFTTSWIIWSKSM